MRRLLVALLTTLAMTAGLATPAAATDYGRPSGKWFEAIVTHEMGHCLGWYEHLTSYPSIMRPKLSPSRINSGTDRYLPTSDDRARIQRSRVHTVAGETKTYYVQYPFTTDDVRVYNKTGRSSAFLAANQWDEGTSFTIYPVTSAPMYSGVTIVWDSSLAGQSIGGFAEVTEWKHNGSFWQIEKCTIHVNTYVVT